MFTAEQTAAVERRDVSLLVRAGAGTGKTSVLVERFVQAVREDDVEVERILAITFTEKAAAEMKERVRARLVELDMREEARAAEGAWISTIHRFCARVLRTHALTAGIDPEYRVLDELESERLGLDAFDRAIEDLLREAGGEMLEQVASYTPDRLRDMVRTAFSWQRSRGRRYPHMELPPEPPDGTAEAARLASAALAAAADLEPSTGTKTVATAIERLQRCREATANGALPELGALKGFAFKPGNTRALGSAPCTQYLDALAAYRSVVMARDERRTQEMLAALVEGYGGHLERLKRDRSGLDFEDLELITRDLLDKDEGIRQSYAERFDHVLVDEFQDVNPLQNELLSQLERDNLFRVGDERQSIYGFRNADVEVFTEHHAEAEEEGRAQSVTMNFRSRREVLDGIDLAFSRLWGEGFEPLRAGRDGDAAAEPRVELLVTDREKRRWDERFGEEDEAPFGSSLRSSTPWRAAEARLLARRLEEVAREGGHEWGDIVVLMRATTHMTLYERALEERGIPTHVVGGRGYWSQQQVGDLRNWLAALANPRDELSLLSVLASPLAGVSLDGVALLGLRADKAGRDPWWGRQAPPDGLFDGMLEGDRRRLLRFVGMFAEERAAAPRVSLERLVDRAVTRTGYDKHVLARDAGDRRMANIRKLMRMAREFEAEEGRDLRRFIDFVAERDLIQSREGEAPLEAEELQRVRLMTIHRAKGLEFPVVFVADLGKEGREENGPLQISNDGRVGLRLASLGADTVKSDTLEEVKAQQNADDEAEERRIMYVALTRAREHLVLSGATDLEKRKEPEDLTEPLRWMWRNLVPHLPGDGACGVGEESYEGRDVRVRWERLDPGTLDELLPPEDRTPVRPAPAPDPVGDTPPLELGMLAAPRALPVARLSYSGLESYRRCGYRFYLSRALRLPASDTAVPAAEPLDALSALRRGDLVHQLLERVDMRRGPLPTQRDVEALIEQHGEPVREADVADLRDMVERFWESPLRSRLGAARRVRAELPFCFTLDASGRSLLINGFVDVYAVEDDRVLIVDYKSDRLEPEASPVGMAERDYSTQRLVYALAALREGAERVEVVHQFLERPHELASVVWEAADGASLERRLLELAGGVVDSRFLPSDEPHIELCAGCPGQPALCSWPPERTLAAATQPAA
jgi:ATP-dependent exoDNAse (exonuclease V) beta subunit